MPDGWIGIFRHVLHYLSVVNADKDEDGKFLVRGSITFFMGMADENAEVVIGPSAEYFVGGRACNLASALRSTSYGKGVTVLG